MWKDLREVKTCGDIIGGLRSDEGFMKVWNSSLEFTGKHDIVAPSLHHDSDSVTGKRKRIPKLHKYFVDTVLYIISRSCNVKCIYKSLLTGRSFDRINNLISDFGIRFNKDFIDIVEDATCLHPFDSFKSFDENDLNVLHNHYLVENPEYNDKQLFLNEHTHYKKAYKRV